MSLPHPICPDDATPRHAEPLVRRATELVAGGTAVDLGTGLGFDALHLAWHGLDVLAVDRRPEPLEPLAALAERRGLRLRTWSGDVLETPWPDEIDVVVLSRLLHLLDRDRGLALIAEAQRRTERGGVHVVVALGGGYDEIDPTKLYLERDELRALYAGWDELAGRSHPVELDLRSDGAPRRFFQHAMLVRKPELP